MLPATRFDFLAEVSPVDQGCPVHLIAAGGSGMSGVARLYLERGHPVSGSDALDSPALRELRALGAQVHQGHAAGHVPAQAVVVISSAVREENVELQIARERGQQVLHRSQAIAALLGERTPVAVAGANGKTTTSAMLTVALQAAGFDPGFVIGAPVSIGGSGADGVSPRSAHLGGGTPVVVEADESDSSFLTYRPQVAVVTNIRPDHLDHYGDLATIQEAFEAFLGTVRDGGLAVVCADDPLASDLGRRVAHQGRVRVLSYGVSENADLRVRHRGGAGLHSRAVFEHGPRLADLIGPGSHEIDLPMPGQHNVLNAAAAYLAAVAGVSDGQGAPAAPDLVLTGLAGFPGAHRRFQRVGEGAGVRVIDDYAHNADKVAALVQAGRAVLGEQGRLVIVFQPHLFSRTRDFAAEFAQALQGADVAAILDIYPAREQPIPGVTGRLVLESLTSSPQWRGEALWLPDRADAAATLLPHLQSGDLVITVGAGDVTAVGPELVSLLTSGGLTEQGGG